MVWKVVGKYGRRHNSQSRKLGAQILTLKNRAERANQEQDKASIPQRPPKVTYSTQQGCTSKTCPNTNNWGLSVLMLEPLGDSYSSNHYHCQFLLYHVQHLLVMFSFLKDIYCILYISLTPHSSFFLSLPLLIVFVSLNNFTSTLS